MFCASSLQEKKKDYRLLLVTACNLVFLIYLVHYLIPIPHFILSIIIGLTIFIVPGYVWTNRFNENHDDFISVLFKSLLLSTLLLIITCVVFRILKVEITSFKCFIIIFLVTNTRFVIVRKKSFPVDISIKKFKYYFVLFSLTLLVYGSIYLGATKIVPPMEDLDNEAQGTAYGLINHLKPYMVTNRKMTYYFAHPPSLHFYIGAASLFYDKLEELSYYYISAKRAETQRGVTMSENDLERIWLKNLKTFFEKPLLLPTRMPSIFFSALTVIVFIFLIKHYTSSYLILVLAPLLYFTFPEVFVRSCFAGYLAIDNFILLIMAYLYITCLEENKGSNLNFLFISSGCFAAFADQKTLIFPLALFCTILTARGTGAIARLKSAFSHSLIVGFVIGIAIYVAYGVWVDAKTFIDDQVMWHFINRFRLDDIRVIHSSEIWYPSIIEVWREFGHNLGYHFLFIGSLLAISSLKNKQDKIDLFGYWFLIGAVLFSITDWRQTRHFMLIIPPMIICTLLFLDKMKSWIRYFLIGLLGLLIMRNIWMILQLANNFEIIKPTPIW